MDYERVSVYYLSSDGGDWALYLQNKLNTREYHLDTVLNDLMCLNTFHRKSAKLNVFLITPHFMNSYVNFRYLENFDKMTSILILAGVEFRELEEEANCRDCGYILEWCVHELRETEESIRNLMIKIIEMYEGHHVDVDRREHVDDNIRLPRQINEVVDIIQKDDNVYILLERPPDGPISVQFPLDELTAEYHRKVAVCSFSCKDLLYTLTSPDGTSFTVVSKGAKLSSGRLQNQPEGGLYTRLTSSCISVASQTDVCGQEVTTALNNTTRFNNDTYECGSDNGKSGGGHDVSNIKKSYEQGNEEFHTERLDAINRGIDKGINAIDMRANDNGDKPDSHDTATTSNGDEQDNKEARPGGVPSSTRRTKLELLRQILEDEVNPIRLLCSALRLDSDDEGVLDKTLAGMIDGLDTLRKLVAPSELHAIDDADQSVWPSLLHFGAQYNFTSLCTTLISNRLGHHACATPNRHGMVPHEMAQQYGHVELATILKNVQVEDRRDIVSQISQCDSGFCGGSVLSLKMSGGSGESDDGALLPDPPKPHTANVRRHPYSSIDVIDEDEALNERLEHQKHGQLLRYKEASSCSILPSSPSDEVLPTKQHKKGGLFGRIFRSPSKKRHRQNRRCSEPAIPTEIQAQLRQHQKQTIQENQQRRRSVRISHAVKDTSLQGPKLPTRNKKT